MVAQGLAMFDPNLTPEERAILMGEFLEQVLLFVIYSCGLGAVMLVFTYISIMLFNYAAHSQVKLIIIFSNVHQNYIKHIAHLDLSNSRKIFEIRTEPRYCLVRCKSKWRICESNE